jgi:hypothetical protein
MRNNSIKVAKAAIAVAMLVSLGAVATTASADEIQMLRNIGDGYQSVQVITHYEINTDKRFFDLTAAVPHDSRISRATNADIAGETVHAICSSGKIGGAWTVRIFLPGEASPVASCRPGGHPRHAH